MRKIKALTKMEGVGFCRILRVFYMPTETTSLPFQLYNVHRNFDHFPQTGNMGMRRHEPELCVYRQTFIRGSRAMWRRRY